MACSFVVHPSGLLERTGDEYEFWWIVDFPLLTPPESGTGRFVATHHPFTAPHPDDIGLLDTDPTKVRSGAMCNGS